MDNTTIVKEVIDKILHDMRTPLAVIKFGISGIEDYLPSLLFAYGEASKAGLINHPIPPTQLHLLSCILNNIKLSVKETDQKLDELYAYINNGF